MKFGSENGDTPEIANKQYPLVNIQKTMERSTIFHGQTHYFDWAIYESIP
jgi:hypothetical protein